MENLDQRLIELMNLMDKRLIQNYDISDLVEKYNTLWNWIYDA